MSHADANIIISLPQLAKTIDHSLLQPTLTDAEILAGLELAKRLKVAAACVKPYSVPVARDVLEDTGVLICAVVGFPHGNSTTSIKVAEAEEALREGAHEIDMVVNVGKVLGGDWEYVTNEIHAVNAAVSKYGRSNSSSSISGIGGDSGGGSTGGLKVIFETDFLEDEHIHLCKICAAESVAFVKTSTGYGFVKQQQHGGEGGALYACKGATARHIRLMKASVGPNVRVKAAGGIRSLDEALVALAAGASRIGASATQAIYDEAVARGIGTMPVRVSLRGIAPGLG